MIISNMRIKRIDIPNSKLVGAVTVTFDKMVAICEIKILRNDGRMFLGMPGKEVKPGEFRDMAHPVNKQAREAFEKLIFAAFEKMEKDEIDFADFKYSGAECCMTKQEFEDFAA